MIKRLLVIILIVLFTSNVYAEYTSQYPTQDGDHVKATTYYTGASGYEPYVTTNPANSLTGDRRYNNWLSDVVVTNQRFHIDLGSGKVVTRIYYENSHHFGDATTEGAKDFTFWGSNESSAFTTLTYGTDTNWTQLTTSQSSFDQHAASDASDPKYITVSNSTSYRYYAFKFANNWGSGTFMGVRRIELQTGTSYTGQVFIKQW